ncbi:MAG TPA: hypothetical protein VF476_19020 [Chitinophagaceae bacterium]
MNKIYFLLLAVSFTSCVPAIRYVGESLPPTKKVDVYVARESIKQPFEFIGKGYLNNLVVHANPETIQKKAILMARQKGADAVLITDQYVLRSAAFGTNSIDSIGKAGLSFSRADPTTEMNIFFIKYNK